MSGGRFLVSLREVNDSERILQCRALLKADITFWEEPSLAPESSSSVDIDALFSTVEKREVDIDSASLSDDSAEVAVFVAGYIGKNMIKRLKCDCCESSMTSTKAYPDQCYFTLISRGGLTKPSPALAEFVIRAFALLDVLDTNIMTHQLPAKMSAEKLLYKYLPTPRFTCNQHIELGLKWAVRSVVNNYYNNKRKIVSDSVQNDHVATFKHTKRNKQS